jgi:outer membrane protein assembly factor BamB
MCRLRANNVTQREYQLEEREEALAPEHGGGRMTSGPAKYIESATIIPNSGNASSSRWIGIVCGTLLISTGLTPWGLDGETTLWPRHLFDCFFAFPLKAMVVAAWATGLTALGAGIILHGMARTTVYAMTGSAAFAICLFATRAHAATLFVPVLIPCLWCQAAAMSALLVLLLSTGARLRGRLSPLQSVSAPVVLATCVYGVLQSAAGLPGIASLLAIVAALLGSAGCVLIFKESFNSSVEKATIVGRRLLFAGLLIFIAHEVLQPLFFARRSMTILWNLNEQIVMAASALLALEGLIGISVRFSRAAPVIAAALVIGIGLNTHDWDEYHYTPKPASAKATATEIQRRGDWTQWCGGLDRNMVSNEKGLPTAWDSVSGKKNSELQNIKWVTPLGTRAMGSPVISGGKVWIGGETSEGKNEFSMLWCFQESDGKLLWRMKSPYIPHLYNVHTFGNCATPTIDGDRLYMLNHLGDVLCLSANGMGSGNQGPFTDEAGYFATGRKCTESIGPDGSRIIELTPGTPATLGPLDADILWRFDLLREVNCWPFNALNAAVVLRGERLYVPTCSTFSDLWFEDESSRKWILDWKMKSTRKNEPYPSPSLIVLDRATGKLLARNDCDIFEKTFHGAHASPALGIINGVELLVYAGGNGTCYAFNPEFKPGEGDQPGTLELIWSFDCLNGRISKAECIATPVLYKNRVYASIGNDLTRSGPRAGPGRLVCFDATQSGTITRTALIWSFDDIRSTVSTVAIADGLLYTGDAAGNIYCLDAETGKLYWSHSTAPVWTSPLVADGKVYIGTHGHGMLVFEHAKEKKLLAENLTGGDIIGSPAAANGVLYVATQTHLYAIESGKTGGLIERPADVK